MKRIRIARVFSLAIAVGALATSSAGAQTCANPQIWIPGSGQAAIANTCTLPDSVALYCDFLDSAGKSDAIYQLTLPPNFTGTSIQVFGGVPGFNPVIYLYSSSCSAGTGCAASGDVNNPLALTGVSPGTYFVAATAASSDASGACGVISLSTNLPVELQSFEMG